MLVLLTVATVVAFGCERAKWSGYRSVAGEVVGVARVFGGKGGDSREFTIHYRVDGDVRQLVTRRGIIDHFGGFRDLRKGDTVPVAVESHPQGDAVLDSINARYPITLSIGALLGIAAVTGMILVLSGRLRGV